jgi:hypothetical protein
MLVFGWTDVITFLEKQKKLTKIKLDELCKSENG